MIYDAWPTAALVLAAALCLGGSAVVCADLVRQAARDTADLVRDARRSAAVHRHRRTHMRVFRVLAITTATRHAADIADAYARGRDDGRRETAARRPQPTAPAVTALPAACEIEQLRNHVALLGRTDRGDLLVALHKLVHQLQRDNESLYAQVRAARDEPPTATVDGTPQHLPVPDALVADALGKGARP